MRDFQHLSCSHTCVNGKGEYSFDSNGGNNLPRRLIAFGGLTVLFGFAAAMLFLPRNSAGAILILIASLLLAIMEFQTYIQFFSVAKMSFAGVMRPRDFVVVVFGSIIVAFLLEAGTLVGAAEASPFILGDWRPKRFLAFLFIVYAVALLCLEYVPEDFVIRAKKNLCRLFTLRALLVIAAYLLPVFLAIVIGFACSHLMGLSLTPQIAFWFFVFTTVATSVLCFGFDVLSCQFAVFLTILIAGSSIIVAVPISNLLSWDDEIHYSNALNLSYFSDVELSSSDIMLSNLFEVQDGHTIDASMNRFPIDASLTWHEADIAKLIDELDAGYARGPIRVYEGVSPSAISYSMFGYLPSAVGLWLGRLFDMPLSWIFMFGRLANLVCYAVVCYFAIKIIPCKKILMSVLALMPTTVFMAANYAYDPWVISFGFLSVALIVKTLLSNESLNGRTVFAIALSFFLGLAPKAVYFPLIGLMFLIPARELPLKARRGFYIFVVTLGLIVVASFLIPLVVSNGGGAGDARGGAGVNSSEQIRYVLGNPGAYASMMINFLMTGYLTISTFGSASVQWAYLSDLSASLPCLAYAVVFFVFLVSLIDSDSVSKKLITLHGALWTLFLIGIAVVGICTALYFSYTPVALDWINGVQPRYLLPLVLPLFIFVLNAPIERKWGKRLVPLVVLLTSGLLLAFTSWTLLFSRLLA